MPGGTGNIRPSDNPHPFTSENQPKNRRKSTKFLTDLLIKEFKNKEEIEVEGINVVTGEWCKVRYHAHKKKHCSGTFKAAS
jgi:hypothetical protein